jgi:hypothetical protein
LCDEHHGDGTVILVPTNSWRNTNANDRNAGKRESWFAHLRTKYVFIDTQGFRKARCDWNGRLLSKVAEFAKEGQLRLLVTDVTIGEVKSQIRELVKEATDSLRKHRAILDQLAISLAIDRLGDHTAAI